MYYKDAAKTFRQLLEEEKMKFEETFVNHFLSILQSIFNYTEEDHLVRPQIILGSGLSEYFKTIPQHNYFVMSRDNKQGEDMARLFKSLALFCDNGWYIVINQEREFVEYGLFRKYTEISGVRFEDFFEKDFDTSFDSRMIIIKVRNSYEVAIIRYGKEDEIISQHFIETDDMVDSEIVFSDMANDIISGIEENFSIQVKNCLLKFFRNFPLKVHGTIILVVSDAFSLPSDKLSGIEISPPIDYFKYFMDYETIESYSDAECIYALMGMMYEMLNTDGITIITDKARLLYYNVFYKGDIPQSIRGGARKRTALGIIHNKDLKEVKGVYFQSQDGDLFYERKSDNE